MSKISKDLFIQEDTESKGQVQVSTKSNPFQERVVKPIKEINLYTNTAVIDLVFPIQFDGKLIDKVVIKKMYVSDISALRKMIQKYDLTNARNISTVYKFFELVFSSSLSHFLYENGEAVNTTYNPRLIGALPVNNIIRLLICIFLLNRERPYISTNYECSKCKTLNMFDLDPEDKSDSSPPEGEYHSFMENIFDFLVEDYDIFDKDFGLYEYRLDLKRPFSLVFQGEEVQVESIVIEYPTLGLYSSILSNPRKKDDFELWLLFESIKKINDFDDQKTDYFKKTVGLVEFFKRFDVRDFKTINQNLFRDGISFEHSFVCMNCGAHNKTEMDLSNFFGFLLD